MHDNALLSRATPFVFASVQAILTLQCYSVAAVGILYYDYILTFKDEIMLIWRQKKAIVSIIFLLNRYLTLLGYIPVLIFLFHTPNNQKACTAFAKFPGSLSTITQTFIAVILCLRVYALYQRKTWVLVVTAPLGLLTVAVSAWGLSEVETVNLSFGTQSEFKACIPSTLKSSISFKLSWLCSTLFDSVVFALTLYKTYRMNSEHRATGVQSGLTKLLIRDGSLYYIAMAILNLVNVLLFLKIAENTFFEESAGNNSMLTHTISSTLLSRLILNLRQAGSGLSTDTTTFSSHFSARSRFSRSRSEGGVHLDDIMLVPASTFSSATRSTDITKIGPDEIHAELNSLENRQHCESTPIGSNRIHSEA